MLLNEAFTHKQIVESIVVVISLLARTWVLPLKWTEDKYIGDSVDCSRFPLTTPLLLKPELSKTIWLISDLLKHQGIVGLLPFSILIQTTFADPANA